MRDAVQLRFRQDLSYQEMAVVTGARVGALRVRVLRALEALRRCLERKGVSLR
jgi:DNA-directed RNA polymerase specialized sigma24 family protein